RADAPGDARSAAVVRAAVAEGDPSRLQLSAHALKGGVATGNSPGRLGTPTLQGRSQPSPRHRLFYTTPQSRRLAGSTNAWFWHAARRRSNWHRTMKKPMGMVLQCVGSLPEPALWLAGTSCRKNSTCGQGMSLSLLYLKTNTGSSQ